MVEEKIDIKTAEEKVKAMEQMLDMTTTYMDEIRSDLEVKKTELEKSNLRISQSLNFSSVIQKAIQPSKDDLDDLFDEHFVLNRPKDIIGGDLLWVRHAEDKIFVAVMDCTGHGIPGAMLSMAAHFSLNATFDNKSYDDPTHLLTDFNNQFYGHFHMHKSADEWIKHGLDIGMVIIDRKHKTIKYSGTHQSLVLTTKQGFKTFKGSSAYIGDRQLEMDRGTYTIDLKEGQQFYMFTDGAVDQFGGPHNKKILPKRIHRALKYSHGIKMQKQKEIIDAVIMDWKGGEVQTDDILMIGFKTE